MEINIKNIVNLSNHEIGVTISNTITVTSGLGSDLTSQATAGTPGPGAGHGGSQGGGGSGAAQGSPTSAQRRADQSGAPDISEGCGEGGGGSGAAQGRPTSAKRREIGNNDTGTDVVIEGSPPQISVGESEAELLDQAGHGGGLGADTQAPRDGVSGAGRDGVEGDGIEEIILEDTEAEGRPPQPPVSEAAVDFGVHLNPGVEEVEPGFGPDSESRLRRHSSWSESCSKKKCERCIEKGL